MVLVVTNYTQEWCFLALGEEERGEDGVGRYKITSWRAGDVGKDEVENGGDGPPKSMSLQKLQKKFKGIFISMV